IGVISGAFVGGGMFGTLIAGPIAEGLSWHWMFAIPTFAIIGATVLTYVLMPDDPPVTSEAKVDVPGLVLMSGVLLTLILVLAMAADIGSQPLVLVGLLLLLAVLVTAFVAVERRAATPIIDMKLLATPAIWS